MTYRPHPAAQAAASTAPEPYAYTDPQNHRLTLRPAPNGRHLAVHADNLAIGGEHVDVWQLPADVERLADALADGVAYEYTDHLGDRLTVEPSREDWTVFELTRAPRDDDEEPATVRVVVLSARIPELCAALTAAVEEEPPASTPNPADREQPRAEETRLALVDGRDALAFVVIRPATDAPDNVTVEAGSRGMSKAAAAYVLRTVADEFDTAALAEGDEPIPYTLTEQAEAAAEQPTAPAKGDRYVKRAEPDAGRVVTVNDVWTAHDGHTDVAYEWGDRGQCGSACPLDVFHRAYEPATSDQAKAVEPRPNEPRIVVDVNDIEAALRDYLAHLDYDLHKGIQRNEETGEDTYHAEAADLFARLATAAEAQQ